MNSEAFSSSILIFTSTEDTLPSPRHVAANDIPPGGNLHVPHCFSFPPLYFCYCSYWPPFLLRNLYLVHRDLLVFVFYFFPTGSHALDSRQVKYFRLLPCSFCYPSFTFSVSSSQPAPTAELGPSPSEVHSHFMAICPVRACLFLSRATPPKLLSQIATQCFPALNLALTNFPLSHRGNTSVSPISSVILLLGKEIPLQTALLSLSGIPNIPCLIYAI